MLYLTIGSYIGMHSLRYEAHRKFEEHKRCIKVARGIALSIASWVLSKLPKCFISWWMHSWHMNQLFYNIFNPMVLNVIKGFISFRKTFCYAVNDLVSMFSLNCCLKVLTSFLVVKSHSKKSWRKFFFSRDCLLTSWACTIGIWSTLTQLNLIRQICLFVVKVKKKFHQMKTVIIYFK